MTAPSPSPHETASGRHGAPRARPWSGWAPYLAQVPLFADLPHRHLKKVAGLADLRWYGDGKTLVRAGSPGDAFYAILEGRAQLQTPSGHTRMLEVNESFGELALIDGEPRSATIVSVGGVSVARIERAAILRLLNEEPDVAVGLARGLATTFRDLEGTAAPTGVIDVAAAVAGSEGQLRAASPEAAEGTADAGAALPLLAGVPLFAGLSRRHLRKVAQVAEPKHYPDGATVVRIGARGAVFHVIVQGRARAVTADGREHPLKWGESFGELSLIDGGPRSASVVAVGELGTLCITRPDFLKILKEEPSIAAGLVRGLVALIRDVQRDRSV
jgi:CRP-like cAMP-binding protein